VAEESASAVPAAPCGLWRVPLDFFCRCSKERFLDKMGAATARTILQELQQEAGEGKPLASTVLECHFCSAKYEVQELEMRGRAGG
jgi:redox-regulated HSP33 family molecular chaperone